MRTLFILQSISILLLALAANTFASEETEDGLDSEDIGPLASLEDEDIDAEDVDEEEDDEDEPDLSEDSSGLKLRKRSYFRTGHFAPSFQRGVSTVEHPIEVTKVKHQRIVRRPSHPSRIEHASGLSRIEHASGFSSPGHVSTGLSRLEHHGSRRRIEHPRRVSKFVKPVFGARGRRRRVHGSRRRHHIPYLRHRYAPFHKRSARQSSNPKQQLLRLEKCVAACLND